MTLLITAGLVALCFWIKSHYLVVAKSLAHLRVDLSELKKPTEQTLKIDPTAPTAVILVGAYGGLGLYTVKSILKIFPGIFKNFIFVSVGVIDSGAFKGEDAVQELRGATEKILNKYVKISNELGIPALGRLGIGTEIVQEGFEICEKIMDEFPRATFFTGKVIFQTENWFTRLLHNETAFALQKRLQIAGHTMVILPAKIG